MKLKMRGSSLGTHGFEAILDALSKPEENYDLQVQH
jgi:predicted glycosyltransferase involved in capsule biosynthesis